MRNRAPRRFAAILGAMLVAAPLMARADQTPPPPTPKHAAAAKTKAHAAASASSKPCPNPAPCGANCSNHPFEPTDCWTTKYGPAKADVVISPTNLLYCNGDAYALCFFSGPPNKTGINPKNQPLPCVLKGDVANCTCQVYTSGANFVDINGILNRGAYFETVNACGADGSGCQNMHTCGPDGTKSGCGSLKPAPVCQYVKNQNPNNPSVSLMPKADLISTFSTAMIKDHPQGIHPPDCTGPYAGCMTAPCFFKPGHTGAPVKGETIQCECPVYNGTYQVGAAKQACTIPPNGTTQYVWSAANNLVVSSAAAGGGN